MSPSRSPMQILTYCALLLAIFVTEVVSEKDNIVKLTKFNFDNNVERGAWFVKFYAPWCTHCQRLAPIWEKLADEAAAKDWPVKIAEVDCTSSKEVCERVQVKAFPMLLLINDGTLKDKYQGEASVPGFESWLNEQLSMRRRTDSSGGHATKGKEIRATKESQEASTTTSPLAAFKALASYKLARFPTSSKILNIYIYGAVVLAFLVGVLYAVFQYVEAEESVEREHQD